MAEIKAAEVSQKKKSVLNNTAILFLILVAMFGIFSYIGRPWFFSRLNIIPMINNLSFIGIVAAVLTMVMISGEIDFSVGGNIGLTACLTAVLLERGLPGWLVVIIALAAGAAMGAFNGMLVTVIGVNSIMATIGTMFIWRGIGYTLTNGESMLAMNPVIDFIGRGFIFKVIPFPIVLLVIIFVLTYVIMNHSKWGRRIYAIGANPLASYLSGINVKRVKFIGFLLCGITASLGGLILTSLSAVGMPQHGQGLELVIVSSIILGGTVLGGGKGQILGTLAGVLILSILYNFLTIMNVYYFYIQIVQGSVLIIVVSTYEIGQAMKRRRM
ncbi:MAG: ABC transporter permease [Actinobacteria bacterium]|nr:ABC transporter permease [Actinomycetota bacterium]MBU4450311.1 ABC transporter permease [Actinomycetota bacterium]MCG2789417.1 ABC transporter permease [Actinomycetes bacterium]